MPGLTAYQLKWIAIITMVIDHIGMVFFPDVILLRIIGRMSFVIFSFLLVEGFLHSRDVLKYIKRLSIWAIISEVPFDYAFTGNAFDPNSQNIFFTLLSGLISIYIISTPISSWLKLAFISIIILVSTILRFDYNILGLLQIISFYILRNHVRWIKFSVIGLLNAFLWGRVLFQSWAILAFIPIAQYNGLQGKKMSKLFYSFYAIHLTLIGLIKHIMLSGF